MTHEEAEEKRNCLSAVTAPNKNGKTGENSEWMAAINSEVTAGQQIILLKLMKETEAKPFISEKQNTQVSLFSRASVRGKYFV